MATRRHPTRAVCCAPSEGLKHHGEVFAEGTPVRFVAALRILQAHSRLRQRRGRQELNKMMCSADDAKWRQGDLRGSLHTCRSIDRARKSE